MDGDALVVALGDIDGIELVGDGIGMLDVGVDVGALEVGVGDGVPVGNCAGGSVVPGGKRFSEMSSQAMPLWMHWSTRKDIAAGSHAFMKSECRVMAVFVVSMEASVIVARVESTGKRSAKVSCGSRTG